MTKSRGYRRDVPVLDEAILEEIKEEVIKEAVEEEPVVLVMEKLGKVTNCLKLNLRKRPGTDTEIIRVLNVGEEVKILDESTMNGWLPIKLSDGTKGHCMKAYIEVIN